MNSIVSAIQIHTLLISSAVLGIQIRNLYNNFYPLYFISNIYTICRLENFKIISQIIRTYQNVQRLQIQYAIIISIKYNMQTPIQKSQQSHQPTQQDQEGSPKISSSNKQGDKKRIQRPTQLQNHISIDAQLIKQKQKLLSAYHQQDNDNDKLSVIQKWPNEDIQNAIMNAVNISKTNNGCYFGTLSNEMFHGYGLLIYDLANSANKSSQKNQRSTFNKNFQSRFYEGEFQNNCKHGYGFQYIDGDIYIGKFINNKPEDANGIFMWKNGDLFMGTFVNGMKHGQGRWQSGKDYYQGSWKLNRPEGIGKIRTHASEYEGDIKNGYKHGRGIQIFSNGDRYEGLYANGKPEGDGVYSWKNGAIYKGQFKNGIRYGYGSWAFGSQGYEGDYINDKRNGQGVYKWGTESYYKGQFLDDLRHGFGQMHWTENSYYKGQWRQGTQSGAGQIWEDGKIISKGMFEDGKLIKQPNRLQRSNATQSFSSSNNNSQARNYQQSNTSNRKSQPRYKKSEEKQGSYRYPKIEQKERSHSHHHQQKNNLSQIDEFPKVNKNVVNKNKKYAASTSFSNHARTSGSFNMPNHHSFQHNNRQAVKIDVEMPVGFLKNNHKLYYSETPNGLENSGEKKNISAKKIYEKKKLNVASKTASKSSGVVDMGETQLGPIKWRNFTHMKNSMGDASHNIPLI